MLLLHWLSADGVTKFDIVNDELNKSVILNESKIVWSSSIYIMVSIIYFTVLIKIVTEEWNSSRKVDNVWYEMCTVPVT